MPTVFSNSFKPFAKLAISLVGMVCVVQSVSAQSATFTAGAQALPPLPAAGGGQQQVYTVKAGDTLFGISRALGVDARQISSANGLGNGNVIYIGQRLVIPTSAASPVARPAPVTTTTGGAFDPYAASGINTPQPSLLQPAPVQPRTPLTVPTTPTVQPLIQPSIGNAGQAAGRKVMHVVRPGDTLGGIASRYGVNPRSIIEENRLGIPIQIYVDQALFIPGVGAGANSQITTATIAPAIPTTSAQPSLTPVTPAAAIPSLSGGATNTVQPLPVPLTTTPVVPTEPQTTSLTPIPPKPGLKPRLVTTIVQQQATPKTPTTTIVAANEQPAATPKQDPKPSVAASSTNDNASALADPPPDRTKRFAWPARGRLLSSYGTKTNGLVNDGVNIDVDVGTEVRAADDGVVAYAGSALKGFGNLLLVKHADNWITAYAHNSTLKVAKGDQIKRGQLIALSGQTGNVTRPQLHFEVRQNGRALNPMKYLSN